jgi:very-short-patch-repair endonuclease
VRHDPNSELFGISVGRDRQIGALAAKQGGYVTRGQLSNSGFARWEIDHRLEIGRLIRVYHGVYAVGRIPTLPCERAQAALLAVGDGAGLDGWSAAAHWGVSKLWPGVVEVVSPLARSPKGIKVRHCTRLQRSDIRHVDGLRVLSPALTVLQIAPTVDEDRLTWTIDRLRLRRGLTIRNLEVVIERFPRAPGTRHLRAVLPELQEEPTRSWFEQRWPAFAAKHNLPPYTMNKHVLIYRTDVLFLPDRLIVELDGPQHEHPWAVDEDNRRDAEILAKCGIPTIRITIRQFETAPGEQADRIIESLARRPG